MARLDIDNLYKKVGYNWEPWLGIDEEIYELMVDNPRSVMIFTWTAEKKYSGRESSSKIWEDIYASGSWTDEGLAIINSWRFKHWGTKAPEIDWV